MSKIKEENSKQTPLPEEKIEEVQAVPESKETTELKTRHLAAEGKKTIHLPIVSEEYVSEAGDRVNALYDKIQTKGVSLADSNKELDQQFGEGYSKKNPEMALRYNDQLNYTAESRSMHKVYIFAFSTLAIVGIFTALGTKRLIR